MHSRSRVSARRRRRALSWLRRALPLAVLLLAAGPPTAALAYDDAGYLAYADRMQERLDPLWHEESGQYRPGPGGVDALVNSLLLLTHSVAAQQGHTGPARNDHRARLIARALVSPPVFIERPAAHPRPGSQTHAPGWTSSMWSSDAGQHLVFDAEIVDGLVHAWKARRALGLSDETAAKIADRIHRVASSRFFRWPSIRLNQVNWYALMYAADATVTGRPGLLRRDLRGQLARFVRGRNFGAGMRFQYLPHLAAYARSNLDSAEYANIVLSFLRFYNQARRAGMAPLSRAGRSLVRRWERRAIAGYWTHGGLPQLGHRPRVRSLAPGEEARARAAGADRDRADAAGCSRRAGGGRGRSGCSTAGCSFYEQLPVGEGGLPDPVLFKLFTRSAERRQRPPGRGSAAGQRRPRGRGRSRPHARRRAAAAVRLRPRHRPPRRHHARLQHRDRRGQPARVPLRRHRARAPLRRGSARGRQRRRPRARGVRAARAPAGRSPRLLLPDRPCADRPGGHAAAAHAGADRDRGDRGHRAGRQGLRRAVQGSPRARHAHRRALPGRHVAPLHARARSRPTGGSSAATGARGCASTS